MMNSDLIVTYFRLHEQAGGTDLRAHRQLKHLV